MTDYTDEELMSFVKNQGIFAFEELFHRYDRRVFAFFCRLVGSAEEARETTRRRHFLDCGKAELGTPLKEGSLLTFFRLPRIIFCTNIKSRSTGFHWSMSS